MAARDVKSPETRARERAKYFSGLIWHAGTFLIINVFFWAMDLGIGSAGLNWSFWITGMWGLALAFHTLAYIVDGRRLEERKAAQYLEEYEAPHRPT